MPQPSANPVTFTVGEETRLSGLLQVPPRASACFVFAHGAGAGMAHPFMAAVANGLAERNIATLRYQFPYMEKRAKRPDPPKVAHAAVRAAVAEARRHLPNVPLIAGGKSFGGRMTSQAQALEPLEGVVGARVPRLPAAPGESSIARARRASRRCDRSRCCSCRARAMRSQNSASLSRCARPSEAWQR